MCSPNDDNGFETVEHSLSVFACAVPRQCHHDIIVHELFWSQKFRLLGSNIRMTIPHAKETGSISSNLLAISGTASKSCQSIADSDA